MFSILQFQKVSFNVFFSSRFDRFFALKSKSADEQTGSTEQSGINEGSSLLFVIVVVSFLCFERWKLTFLFGFSKFLRRYSSTDECYIEQINDKSKWIFVICYDIEHSTCWKTLSIRRSQFFIESIIWKSRYERSFENWVRCFFSFHFLFERRVSFCFSISSAKIINGHREIIKINKKSVWERQEQWRIRVHRGQTLRTCRRHSVA